MLRKPLDSGLTGPQDRLYVYPLTCPLVTGSLLSFPLGGGVSIDLLVATPAIIGDTEVGIQPYAGKTKLAYQSIAKGPAEDLSGQLWRGQIRPVAASAKILATIPLTIRPLEGLVSIEIPASVTQALAPNAEYIEYRADAYTSSPYAIDIESELNGIVCKRAYGDVYVVREVTR
jgi:hypothetical protein